MATDINIAMISGNLTRDPELKYTASGLAVCNFSLACNRKVGEKQEVSFLDCVAWKQGAEFVSKYLKKGDRVICEGSIQQQRWQDKESGAARSRIVLQIKSVQGFGPRRSSNQAEQQAPPQSEEGSP